MALEPTAMGGDAQTCATEDPPVAEEVLAVLGQAGDPEQRVRVRALQTLVDGRLPSAPPGSDELAAWIAAAPLWRGEVQTPPPGLITSLQQLASQSTLSESLLALAVWRGGDVERAQGLLRGLVDRVSDQPVARTLLETLDRQGMVNEQGDPEVAVAAPPETVPEDPVAVAPGVTPAPAGDRTARPGAAQSVEVLVSDGCQKIRQGDPRGIPILLDAVDKGADPQRNFNLCFCLGTGFAREGKHNPALTWYKRAVAQSPGNRDAVAGAARAAELLGRTTEAVGYYRKLRTLDPGNAAAVAYLAKHDEPAPAPTPTPPVEVDPLLPVKPKR